MERFYVSLNSESGGRPGFLGYLSHLSRDPRVHVIALQEVHSAGLDPTVPLTIHPTDPGNRGDNPIRAQLFEELQESLPDFTAIYAPQLRRHLHDCESVAHDVHYGQAMFVRKGVATIAHLTHGCAYRQYNQTNEERTGGKPSAKSMIVAALDYGDAVMIIGNVHGFWSRHGKVDLPERFVQNRGILHMLRQVQGSIGAKRQYTLLLGDLNYTSKMQALYDLAQSEVFGDAGATILNHSYGITETRTRYYPPEKPSREADFALACQWLTPYVTGLGVDMNAPSDHAALVVGVDLDAQPGA